MLSGMMPIPPIHGPVMPTIEMSWGMVAFALALLLLVVLWAVWAVKRLDRTRRQAEMKETGWHYEAFQRFHDEGQPQADAPEEDLLLHQ